MSRSLKITIEESAEFLEKQLKNTRTANQRERIQVLWWLKTGQVQEHQELAHRLGRDKSTITRWLQKYRQGGLSELLLVEKAPGQVPHLTREALAGFKERLEKGAAFKSYGEIVKWLKKEYNLELTYATVYDWVHYRLHAKLKVPRPQSAGQNIKAVELFKKTSSQQSGRFKNFWGLGKRLGYLCQDETRLGLKTLTGKVITARGVKPVAPILWKRENFWLYGVVEPLSGWHFCQEYAHLNGEDFQQFINALCLQLGEDIALVQMDKAGAQITNELDGPENLIPVCQPSHSPELNPIERVWEYIKQQLLGEVFTTLGQLRERLQQVLEKITPEQICSLSSYNFLLEALFYAASY